ncbi:MAG: NADH-quinone oxidoreductase subunit I [Chloroflexi bacterium]|nr:NADH-quinone oxidoreductase subunit I [Chloroflexota bacterium]
MLGLGIGRGLLVTLRHFLSKPITVQYPEERLPVADRFRGPPVLSSDPVSGRELCIACGLCARACPHGNIAITRTVEADGSRRLLTYEIDIGRCLFCGLCEEACPVRPVRAVHMSHFYELAVEDRQPLVYDKERLLELGRKDKRSQ